MCLWTKLLNFVNYIMTDAYYNSLTKNKKKKKNKVHSIYFNNGTSFFFVKIIYSNYIVCKIKTLKVQFL